MYIIKYAGNGKFHILDEEDNLIMISSSPYHTDEELDEAYERIPFGYDVDGGWQLEEEYRNPIRFGNDGFVWFKLYPVIYTEDTGEYVLDDEYEFGVNPDVAPDGDILKMLDYVVSSGEIETVHASIIQDEIARMRDEAEYRHMVSVESRLW